jgi:hypothetical protein
MQYLMLIYHTEKQWAEIAEAEKQKVYGGFQELREDLSGKDKFKGGNALQPTSTAATIRLRNGQKISNRWAVCGNQRAVGWVHSGGCE